MHPTLNENKCFLLVRVGFLYWPFKINKGDVILSKNPRDINIDDVVKRVVGVENDEIIVHPRGWKSDMPLLLDKIKIDKDNVWIQGDNMSQSTDSRSYGSIDKRNIYGKVICQIYPELKWINNTMEYSGQEQKYWDLYGKKKDIQFKLYKFDPKNNEFSVDEPNNDKLKNSTPNEDNQTEIQ